MTKVAAIVGPTAIGKTALSLEVAERLDAEIVSVDSMQVYRGMDIGTAKANAAERARVPHHLLDVFDPSHDLTVSEFRDLARTAIEDISARGRLPLLVGGSGLYFRAVVDELDFPPRAQEVRERLEEEADAIGAETLHERLTEMDPKAAAKIEPSNTRRTIRALEAIELTGRPFSDNDAWERYESIYDLSVVGLTAPRDILFERIEARVVDMIGRGLIAEASALEASGMSRTARQALGYRQILDARGATEDEMRAEIVRATKRFARRQGSWFRSDPRVHWIDASGADLSIQVLEHFRGSLALPLRT
ncbi:MAG: tRNA (adenosine(37)-N6)-dimethylallyltransferase MiaA [Actinomycetota bacterium]